MTPIFLDWNATTPLCPAAAEAMRRVPFGNPASAHSVGRAARRALEDAREQVASLLGATPEEVIFTSGATEANNLALFGLVPSGPGSHVLATRLEHPCVVEPLTQLAHSGVEVEWVPVLPTGHVETPSLTQRVRDETRLVSLMLLNHETGAIQPVRHVAKTIPKSVLVHCDAAQAVGKIPVQFRDLGVTSLSFSGHKFGGPLGVGGLLLRSGTRLRPRTLGGHQQRGHRPGTEPTALAVGLAAALQKACAEMDQSRTHIRTLRNRFWDRLSAADPGIVWNGPGLDDAQAWPGTLNLSFPGCRADVLLMSLDLAGVACSVGSACSSGSLLPSPVLQAMGLPDDRLRSALRFSLGPGLTLAEIDTAADRIGSCVQTLRNRSS